MCLDYNLQLGSSKGCTSTESLISSARTLSLSLFVTTGLKMHVPILE